MAPIPLHKLAARRLAPFPGRPPGPPEAESWDSSIRPNERRRQKKVAAALYTAEFMEKLERGGWKSLSTRTG